MAVQTVHLRAGTEWCGESARIQLVRRSQPKSSGPNCHFVQTPAQLSAAEPPATLRSEQWSARLDAGRGLGKGRGRRVRQASLIFTPDLVEELKLLGNDSAVFFFLFLEANVIIVPGLFVHSTLMVSRYFFFSVCVA